MTDEPFKYWLRLYPGQVLGQLHGMEAHEGHLYTIIWLRVLEDRGPVKETDRSLSRRSGLQPHRVRSALASLIASGRIVTKPDGALDCPFAHDELAFQRKQRGLKSEAGKASGVRRRKDTLNKVSPAPSEKAQQNQQNGRTTAEQLLQTKTKTKTETETPSESLPPLAPKGNGGGMVIQWPFERFWQAWPDQRGEAAAKRAFMFLQSDLKGAITFEDLIAAVHRYAANPGTSRYMAASKWLSEHRFMDAEPVLPPAVVAPVKPNRGSSAVAELEDLIMEKAYGNAPGPEQSGRSGDAAEGNGRIIEGEVVLPAKQDRAGSQRTPHVRKG